MVNPALVQVDTTDFFIDFGFNHSLKKGDFIFIWSGVPLFSITIIPYR